MPAGRPKRPVDDVRVQLKYEQNMKGRARAEREWFKGLVLWIVEQLEEGELRDEILRKVEEHETKGEGEPAGTVQG